MVDLRVVEQEPGPCMTGVQFHEWLHSAKPGDSVVYFVGFLGLARRIQDESVDGMALYAAGYEFGHVIGLSNGIHVWQRKHVPLVDLVQKRLGEDCYAYIAQKKAKR